MSPSAQQSENFPAGWIGDRPEDNLILCPAICNHLVTVTRWLPIVNHAGSRSRCLSSATCGAKHLPRPAQYRSRFATRSALRRLEVCTSSKLLVSPIARSPDLAAWAAMGLLSGSTRGLPLVGGVARCTVEVLAS